MTSRDRSCTDVPDLKSERNHADSERCGRRSATVAVAALVLADVGRVLPGRKADQLRLFGWPEQGGEGLTMWSPEPELGATARTAAQASE